jgi:long-chain acyl-CoA synthetase
MSNFYNWVFERNPHLNQTILSTQSGDYTYGAIQQGVDEYSQMILESVGEIKGKRVALIVASIYNFSTLILTVSKLGGVIVPLSPQLRQEDLVQVLDFVDPHIIFTDTKHHSFDLSHAIRNWAAPMKKETVIFEHLGSMSWNKILLHGTKKPLEESGAQLIACTSGSTGVPKGVILDIGFINRATAGVRTGMNLNQNDKLFVMGQISGVFGVVWLLSSLRTQYHLVFTENLTMQEVVQLYERQPSKKVVSTPSLFKAFDMIAKLSGKPALEQMELVCFAGEAISDDFIQSYADFKAKMMSFLGSSELGAIMYTESDIRKVMDWTLLPNLKYKLKSPSDEGYGEILFQCDDPFLGYYKRPDLTSEVYRDGWFYSGDLGRQTSEGKIELVGRIKDMIKKGGQQVIPGEIEGFLGKHPNVQKAVVIGIPHAVYGEQIVAFIQKENELEIQDLYKYCDNRIARYKFPDQFRFVTEFPMVQGKVDKVSLRKRAITEPIK